jgi:hypothetical protein
VCISVSYEFQILGPLRTFRSKSVQLTSSTTWNLPMKSKRYPHHNWSLKDVLGAWWAPYGPMQIECRWLHKDCLNREREMRDESQSVRYGDPLTWPNVYLRARRAPYGPLLDTVETSSGWWWHTPFLIQKMTRYLTEVWRPLDEPNVYLRARWAPYGPLQSLTLDHTHDDREIETVPE